MKTSRCRALDQELAPVDPRLSVELLPHTQDASRWVYWLVWNRRIRLYPVDALSPNPAQAVRSFLRRPWRAKVREALTALS